MSVEVILFLALTMGFAVHLLGRCRTFTCPECSREVDRSCLSKTAASCPYCFWRATAPKPRNGQPPEGPCRRCGSRLHGRNWTLLWDGHSYCKECIDRAHPELFERAIADHEIVESMPRFRAYMFRWFVVTGFGTLFLIVLLVGLVTGKSDAAFWQASGAFVFGVGGFVTLFMALAALGQPQIKVKVFDGELTVQVGYASNSFPLNECKWQWGSLSQMRNLIAPDKTAVLIRLPGGYGRHKSRHAAVGFTDESREIWQAFLKLADVSHYDETSLVSGKE